MKYFTINELCASETATKYNIRNIPNEEQRQNLISLVENVLDPLRELLGAPIYVNSGFRSKELNKKVSGVSNSQHLTGSAADVHCYDNYTLYKLLKNSDLPFDQLILEKGTTTHPKWLHISWSKTPRKQILFYNSL